jgi:hypothetical protein
MTGVMKKGMVLLVVVFIGFYLFTDPNGLARVAQDGATALWKALTQLFGAIIEFINAIGS